MAKDKSNESEETGGKTPSRQGLYSHTAQYAKEAITFLVETMRDEKTQKSVRISAANKIIDKCLPDLKATELTGEDHGPVQIRIVEDRPTTKDE